MPPKQSAGTSRGRGRPNRGASRASVSSAAEPQSSNPFQSSDESQMSEDNGFGAQRPVARRHQEDGGRGASEPEQQQQQQAEKTIPAELLTRVLHEFFGKEATRISRDANAAVGKYVDVFVREAIARAAVEKRGGFLEVEDLEKIAPQLILDL